MNQIITQENYLETRTTRELGSMILSASKELFNRNPNKLTAVVVKDDNYKIDVIIQQKP